jgi:hypothetical protein
VFLVIYSSGNRIDIDYNGSGRPHSLRLLAPGAAQPVFLLSQITYCPFGVVSGWTWGIGANPSNTYAGLRRKSRLLSARLSRKKRRDPDPALRRSWTYDRS